MVKIRVLSLVLSLLVTSSVFLQPAYAADFGVHVLRPEEIADVAVAFAEHRAEDEPVFVTVPFTLADVEHLDRWQTAFNVAKEKNIVPLVRLTTRFDTEKNAWAVPTRRDVVTLARALHSLEWPQTERHVIFFNEPNHAAEWGGQVNPESFADITHFALQWFGTESQNYVLLPAAADLAAPNGPKTMDAFVFWKRALQAQPDIATSMSGLNSHSYPNPAFLGQPTASGRNSLRGYQHELKFFAQYTDRELPVYITETGWRQVPSNQKKLTAYYQVAQRTVWNDSRIVAVTPFLLKGQPGPFAEFSFFTAESQPTAQWHAYALMLKSAYAHLLTQR